MERTIRAAYGFDATGGSGPIAITLRDGQIVSTAPAQAPADDVIVLPAIANAHDHARPLRPSSVGAFGKPLEIWLHMLAQYAPVDPYLAALAPFARSALGGQAVAMVHLVRPMGVSPLVEEAAAMARAAADVGIRIAFGVGMRDQNPLVYGPADPLLDALDPTTRAEIEGRFVVPMKSIREQIESVDAVTERIAGPMVDVQYAPNGPQWCTDAMWEAVAEASERTGRRITTHLFETRYQREWADRAYPQGLVRRLKEIGVLTPRMTLAHCVHARPDELEIIAEAGCIIATNPSSNLVLRSGIPPVPEMLSRGCRVAMGVDGQALDEDDDALRELRMLWALHAGWGFETTMTTAQALSIALETGREACGAPAGGRIAPGAAADLVLLDRAAIDDDEIMEVDPVELVFARAARSHVRELIVAGRSVVKDGVVAGVDVEAVHRELRAAYRAAMPQRAGLRAAMPAFERALSAYYRGGMGCC